MQVAAPARWQYLCRRARRQARRDVTWLSLMEKDVGDKDGGDDAGQVGDQSGRDGITRLADAHRAEVQGHDIEGGVGRSLEHASEAADKGVDAVSIHGGDQ